MDQNIRARDYNRTFVIVFFLPAESSSVRNADGVLALPRDGPSEEELVRRVVDLSRELGVKCRVKTYAQSLDVMALDVC